MSKTPQFHCILLVEEICIMYHLGVWSCISHSHEAPINSNRSFGKQKWYKTEHTVMSSPFKIQLLLHKDEPVILSLILCVAEGEHMLCRLSYQIKYKFERDSEACNNIKFCSELQLKRSQSTSCPSLLGSKRGSRRHRK